MKKWLFLLLTAFALTGCDCHTVDPGTRGVLVKWGVVDAQSLPPGLTVNGLGSDVYNVTTRQIKAEIKAPCFSSDLQQVDIDIVALENIRKKVGDTLVVEDIIVQNIELSAQLKAAIESKMVQEQEAAKAKFTNQKAEADAETARSVARGEADAIRIRGEAMERNPSVFQLEQLKVQTALIEKWNGVSPTIVGAGQGVSVILPAAGGGK